jgi:hypothetical protein
MSDRQVQILGAPYAPGEAIGWSRSALFDSPGHNAPKAEGHQAEVGATEWPNFEMVRKIILPLAANRRNFGKVSCLRVDSADPANVLSG